MESNNQQVRDSGSQAMSTFKNLENKVQRQANTMHKRGAQGYTGKRTKYQKVNTRQGEYLKKVNYDPTMKNVEQIMGMEQNQNLRNDMDMLIKQVRGLRDTQSKQFMKMLKQTIGNTVLQGKYNDNGKRAIANDNIKSLDDAQIRKAIESAIDGPFSSAVLSTLTPWIKSGSRWAARRVIEHGLPWLKNRYDEWKQTGQGQKVLDVVKDWTGYDIHDWQSPVGFTDTGGLSLPMGVQQGYSKDLDTNYKYSGQSTAQYMIDGVCLQSIQSSFCPESYQHVVPTSDQAMQTLSKKLSTLIQTDKNGNALLAIQPINICSQLDPSGTTSKGAFITRNNPTAAYNPSTGALVPAYEQGPYSSHTDILGKFEIVGFTVQIIITQAPINQKGLVTFAYSQKGFTLQPYDGATNSVGIDQLTAASYCMVNSVNMANKVQITTAPLTDDDQLVWAYNLDVNDQYFYTQAGQTGKDQFIIAITGAEASAEIGTVFMYPNLQFVPSVDKIQFYTLIMPPAGNMTLQCMAQIILLNKNILTLGPVEMAEYCAGLSCIKPCFDAVINYTSQFMAQPHISPLLQLNVGTGTHPGAQGISSAPQNVGPSQEVVQMSNGNMKNKINELEGTIKFLMTKFNFNMPQQHDKQNASVDDVVSTSQDEAQQLQLNRQQHAKNGNINRSKNTDDSFTSDSGITVMYANNKIGQ